MSRTETPRLPKKPTACTCLVGSGLNSCQRGAVVLVGTRGYCKQHAALRGITIPAPA